MIVMCLLSNQLSEVAAVACSELRDRTHVRLQEQAGQGDSGVRRGRTDRHPRSHFPGREGLRQPIYALRG